jgi:hypothetical protein
MNLGFTTADENGAFRSSPRSCSSGVQNLLRSSRSSDSPEALLFALAPAPKGAKFKSPGQRPGKRRSERDKPQRGGIAITRLQRLIALHYGTQGAALGY